MKQMRITRERDFQENQIFFKYHGKNKEGKKKIRHKLTYVEIKRAQFSAGQCVGPGRLWGGGGRRGGGGGRLAIEIKADR